MLDSVCCDNAWAERSNQNGGAGASSSPPGRANRFPSSRPGQIGICSRRHACTAAGGRISGSSGPVGEAFAVEDEASDVRFHFC